MKKNFVNIVEIKTSPKIEQRKNKKSKRFENVYAMNENNSNDDDKKWNTFKHAWLVRPDGWLVGAAAAASVLRSRLMCVCVYGWVLFYFII